MQYWNKAKIDFYAERKKDKKGEFYSIKNILFSLEGRIRIRFLSWVVSGFFSSRGLDLDFFFIYIYLYIYIYVSA